MQHPYWLVGKRGFPLWNICSTQIPETLIPNPCQSFVESFLWSPDRDIDCLPTCPVTLCDTNFPSTTSKFRALIVVFCKKKKNRAPNDRMVRLITHATNRWSLQSAGGVLTFSLFWPCDVALCVTSRVRPPWFSYTLTDSGFARSLAVTVTLNPRTLILHHTHNPRKYEPLTSVLVFLYVFLLFLGFCLCKQRDSPTSFWFSPVESTKLPRFLKTVQFS